MADDEKDMAEEAEAEGGNPILKLLLPVGVVLLAAVAGILVTQFLNRSPSEATAEEDPWADVKAEGQKNEYVDYELEPIIVNLNEPRLARYIRATLTLVLHKEVEKVAREKLELKKSEIKSRLILYLSDLSLAEVRGGSNLNRIQREIHDSLNDWLWPNTRPLIYRVDFKEWAVQ